MDAANQGRESSEFAEWMDGAPSEPIATPNRAASTGNGASLPSVVLADDIFESETRPRNFGSAPPVAKPGTSAPPPGRSVPPPPGRRPASVSPPSVPPPPQGRSVPPPPPRSRARASAAPTAQSRSAPPGPPSSPFAHATGATVGEHVGAAHPALPLKTAGTSVPPLSTTHWAPGPRDARRRHSLRRRRSLVGHTARPRRSHDRRPLASVAAAALAFAAWSAAVSRIASRRHRRCPSCRCPPAHRRRRRWASRWAWKVGRMAPPIRS